MNITVVGAQWGDEGKGKIVDLLASNSDAVVRFQGGHNAGHTLQIDGVTYKLSLLPSGVVRKGKVSIIGSGVVVDPLHLVSEMAELESKGVGITPESLYVAENCCLIFELHRELDRKLEEMKGGGKIGTTGRGIGPAYEDKVARRAIRLCDFQHPEYLQSRVDSLLVYHNALRKGLGLPEITAGTMIGQVSEAVRKILPFAKPVWKEIAALQKQGKKILFEGAQGAMLDVDHGTYPFVTSSNTVSAQSSTGSGAGPGGMGLVLGLAKAYTTRVGSGPFPTELADETGEELGKRGKEFGTVTGRKRRCGWFDAVLVSQAAKISGIGGLVITKLDVLDGFKEVKICVGYRCKGREYDYLPAAPEVQAALEPVYETMPGWNETTFGKRSMNDLPANALKFISRIEELTGVKAAIISTSPEREDSIKLMDF